MVYLPSLVRGPGMGQRAGASRYGNTYGQTNISCSLQYIAPLGPLPKKGGGHIQERDI